MINFKKGKINKKEFDKVKSILQELKDLYQDFYVTKDNLRIFLKDNPELIDNSLKNGDALAYCKDGIALIYGLENKLYRTYIKIIAEDTKVAKNILHIIDWQINETIFAKIKKKNPILDILKSNGFKFAGSRGKEILLKKEPRGAE